MILQIILPLFYLNFLIGSFVFAQNPQKLLSTTKNLNIPVHFIDAADYEDVCWNRINPRQLWLIKPADLFSETHTNYKQEALPNPEIKKINLKNVSDQKWLVAQLEILKNIPKKYEIQNKKMESVYKHCRLSKKNLKAIEYVLNNLLQLNKTEAIAIESNQKWQHLQEMIAALNNNFLHPLPRTTEVLLAPLNWLDRSTNYVGEARRGESINAEQIDHSTFWQERKNLESLDLTVSFDRKQIPYQSQIPCYYEGPKKGFGTNGGFDIQCGKNKFKLRLGTEVKVAPFQSRIFWALGYNVPAFDYVKNMKVKYDPLIFSEYNQRSPLDLEVTLLGFIGLGSPDIQFPLDPYQYVAYFINNKSEKISVSVYKKMSVLDKKTITDVVFQEASLSLESKEDLEIGPWSWNQLDYSRRREYRAVGLLAAWFNWYDSRTDNNKIILQKNSDGEYILKHFITDIGSGLGTAYNLLQNSNAQPEDFPWRFLEQRDLGKSSFPPKNKALVRGYTANDTNRAFYDMTESDARWIAQYIAQLQPQHIEQALKASGFKDKDLDLMFKKIMYRRQQILDFYHN